MNPDTTPTPRTEIYVLNPHPPCVSAEFARELERELAEKTNEVERLREALEMIAAPMRPDGTYNRDRRACELLAKAALAPAPEETQDGATMEEWYGGYTKIESTEPAPRCEAGMLSDHRCENIATLTTNTGYKCSKYHAPSVNGKWRDDVVPLSEKTTQVSDKEPAPEWRELGADEVIQEGDEYDPCHLYKKEWVPVRKEWIGTKVTGSEYEVSFRTRRPLPVQEEMPLKDEERPLLKVMEYCRKWADQHLADLDRDHFYARLGLLVDFATDYYSDEIQKLKQK